MRKFVSEIFSGRPMMMTKLTKDDDWSRSTHNDSWDCRKKKLLPHRPLNITPSFCSFIWFIRWVLRKEPIVYSFWKKESSDYLRARTFNVVVKFEVDSCISAVRRMFRTDNTQMDRRIYLNQIRIKYWRRMRVLGRVSEASIR